MEEVRDAMNQLEQGNIWTGGSESLMREMANTMELQRKLEDAMEKVAMGMTEVVITEEKQTRVKRKREMASTGRQEQEKDAEVLTSESSSLSSSRSEKEQEVPNNKKMKHGQTDSEMEEETWTTVQSFAKPTQLKTRDLARECLKTILNVKATNKKIQPDMKTRTCSTNKALTTVFQRKQTTETCHSPPTASKTTKEMQDQLKGIIAQAEQWQDGIFSLNQLDKAVKGFGDIASYQLQFWDSLADFNTGLCVDKLIRCVKFIQKPTHREKYLQILNKLKQSIDKHQ
ncbi:hypothetical protein JG688_00006524 [Phytophthora aleatoria]|uniref:Uncharacterized protein n=1 Tax=Phytophthora aleatoria TaxID=2496075 RepID=A0A8J5MGP6_9STRA|nr:hypothetical protein JG688_00006524 [Phytophthora aleatoria]